MLIFTFSETIENGWSIEVLELGGNLQLSVAY